MGGRKILIFAVFLSLVTAGSIYYYLIQLKTGAGDSDYKTVIVAAEDVPKNTLIKREMLKKIRIPGEYVDPNAVTNIGEVVGKISSVPIFRGQQINRKVLVAMGDYSKGLSYRVPQGKRAVSVAVNEVSGVSGLIIPGDRVDVVATLDIGSGQYDISQTGFVLQNVEVLAVGKKLDVEQENLGEKAEGSSVEKTVTLAVTPKEAQSLVLASEKGVIRLLLRSPVDKGRVNINELRLQDFITRR